MFKHFFLLLRQVFFSIFLIYTYDSLSISVSGSIPINFFSVSLITLFGFFAMIQLIIFSFYI